jgi:hypothetical protein
MELDASAEPEHQNEIHSQPFLTRLKSGHSDRSRLKSRSKDAQKAHPSNRLENSSHFPDRGRFPRDRSTPPSCYHWQHTHNYPPGIPIRRRFWDTSPPYPHPNQFRATPLPPRHLRPIIQTVARPSHRLPPRPIVLLSLSSRFPVKEKAATGTAHNHTPITHVLCTPPFPGSPQSPFLLRASLIRADRDERLFLAAVLSGQDWNGPLSPSPIFLRNHLRCATPRSQSATGGSDNWPDDSPTRPPTDFPTRVSLCRPPKVN